MKVLFLPETTVKLKNLTSHTRYLVSISAFNAAGDGPRSDPQQGRTHQAGRSPSPFPGLAHGGWRAPPFPPWAQLFAPPVPTPAPGGAGPVERPWVCLVGVPGPGLAAPGAS